MAWNEPGSGGNKDPWGQNNNQQGPPDLDEVVRNIQKKLNKLFGGGSGRSGGNGSAPAGGGANAGNIGIGLILAAVAVLWLLSGLYIVQQGERGVVLRFGAKSEVTEAGLRWHVPWPFETVERVNVQAIERIEIGYRSNERTGGSTKVLSEALMITQDENIIDIQFAVQYRVKDPEAFLFNVREVEETISQATESAVREIAGKRTMDFVLTEGRDEVGQETQKLLQEILDLYQSGIYITKVEMQRADPPEEVKSAFDDAVKAREDEQRFKNEAEAYANDIIPRARGKAGRMIQEAEGYKASVIARAEGDAQRFVLVAREYAKAPRVTRERLYLETMEEVMSNTTKIFVDQKGGNNLLYLPLDKLIGQHEPRKSETGAAESAGDLIQQGEETARRLREDRPDLRSRRRQ
ncbi:MAG: FtsH protease activity modulator HflK [Gammaproteobacteria bacterium]|nr:FtsH protease activity modulator HflK [Gammaproteobacteria bacterium]